MASIRRNGGHGRKNGRTPVVASRTLSSSLQPTRSTTHEAKPTQTEVTHQAIAEAAYYLWLRGGGDQVINWLEAERQLRVKARSGTR